MMYAAASRHAMKAVGKKESHRDLMQHFTDHLVDEEYDYFIKWDRLIDLEADASSSLIARSWLRESKDIEKEVSASVASLLFDPNTSSPDAIFDESWFALIGFKRSQTSSIHTPLSNVGFEPGCRVVIGTDSQSVKPSSPIILDRRVRPQMHIARGSVYKVTESHIFIQASRDDLTRIEICSNSASPTTPTFRMDKENLPTGITTLRQNLVNLFTADKKGHETPGSQVNQSRLSWLRDVLIRLRRPFFDRSIVKHMFTPSQGLPAETVPGCDLKDLYLEFSNLNQDQKAAVEQVRGGHLGIAACSGRHIAVSNSFHFFMTLVGICSARLHSCSRFARFREDVYHCVCNSTIGCSRETRPCDIIYAYCCR